MSEETNEAPGSLEQAVAATLDLVALDVDEREFERGLARLASLGEVADPVLADRVGDLWLRCRRMMRNQMDDDARYFRMLIDVSSDEWLDETTRAAGFRQSMDVVAVDTDGAIAMIAEDLGRDYQGASVVQSELVHQAGDRLLGVHQLNDGRAYYPAE